jgi:hypothetical protein
MNALIRRNHAVDNNGNTVTVPAIGYNPLADDAARIRDEAVLVAAAGADPDEAINAIQLERRGKILNERYEQVCRAIARRAKNVDALQERLAGMIQPEKVEVDDDLVLRGMILVASYLALVLGLTSWLPGNWLLNFLIVAPVVSLIFFWGIHERPAGGGDGKFVHNARNWVLPLASAAMMTALLVQTGAGILMTAVSAVLTLLIVRNVVDQRPEMVKQLVKYIRTVWHNRRYRRVQEKMFDERMQLDADRSVREVYERNAGESDKYVNALFRNEYNMLRKMKENSLITDYREIIDGRD